MSASKRKGTSWESAIVFGGVSDSRDWSRPELALAALADRASGPAQEHPHCDVVVGRISGGYIEFCCPASRSNGLYHGSSHREDEWIDAGWLRLLALSDPAHDKAVRLRSCWTREVARSLRYQLGIDEECA